MNAAARELGLIAAERQRDRIRETARRIRRETNQAPDPRLEPVLVLGLNDRFNKGK